MTKCFIAYQSGTKRKRACVGSYIACNGQVAHGVGSTLITLYNTHEDALECATRGARREIEFAPYTTPHVDVTGSSDLDFLMRYAEAVECEYFYLWRNDEWHVWTMTSEGWGVRESLTNYIVNR